MEKSSLTYQTYLQILRRELVPAMGCTEPIAVAYCAAIARRILNKMPERVEVEASGNIIKNVKSVMVTLFSGSEEARVRIINHHTGLALIEKNGEILFADEPVNPAAESGLDYGLLSVAGIYDFAVTADLDDVKDVLDRQIQYNCAISKEGLSGKYGASIGMVLLRQGNDVHTRARAKAAAGSDARMDGCELPVVINSGSGNQGITVCVPVVEYAEALGCEKERLYRALLLSNLIAVHLKEGIGRLSAYCGAVSAGASAGAAISYLKGGNLDSISHTLVNALAISSGMVCDGAKPSCAAKIAVAVDTGLLAMEMYEAGQQFYGGDGIVLKGVENTIRNVGVLGREGMRETDKTIIDLMTR